MKNLAVSQLKRYSDFLVGVVLFVLSLTGTWAGPLDTLQPGQWYMAPSTNLSALDPCPARNCSYSGVGGQAELIAWSGGAYDTTRDRLIVWGGGHADYGGNEIYAFDIATMSWTRVTNPTVLTSGDVAPANASSYYHDGTPSARHTVNALVYASNVDQFFSMATGATFGSPPNYGLDVDSFNFTTGTWKTDWKKIGANYGNQGTIAAYHPGTGKIWFHPSFNGPLAMFDPTAAGGVGAWTSYVTTFIEEQSAVLLDTKRNRLISMGSAGVRQFLVWDLNNPNKDPTSPTTSGDPAGIGLESRSGIGFIYDPVGDRYIAWASGRTVYALDPTTWVWSAVALDSSNTVTPPARDGRGTFGRMSYIPSKNAFIVVNRTTENVYFFKLTSGSTPLPTVTLNSSATSVANGGNATLTWSSTDATSCTASGAWSGILSTSGSQSVTDLTTPGTYTLTCSGAGGSAAQLVSISVVSATDALQKNSSGSFDLLALAVTAALFWLLRFNRRNAFWPRAIMSTFFCIALFVCGTHVARAGEITTVQLNNLTGTTQTNGVVTFGHYFKAGDVPAGYTVEAKNGSGAMVQLQVDKKATHADGSLRHAILTAKLPSLAGNGSEILTLSSVANSASGAQVALSDVLFSSFDAQVNLNVGGTVYSASAKTLLGSGTPQVWLSGPLVSEWIVGGPVKTAGGVSHAHLNAYFHVRAYQGISRVSVDMVVENNWTLVASPADRTYDATLSVGGTTVYSQTGLTHYRHTRWHKRAWWGSDPQIYAKLNITYLQDSKAIPKYATLTPTESFLNSVRQSTPPMDNGDQTDNMDNTGAQDAIGPLPRWDSVYAVSADVRAFNYMKANADGGAVYKVHFRDENTGYPVTIDNYPNSSLAGGNNSPTIPQPATANPYYEGSFSSHQPSIGYLPYLVTGDYYHLEEMQFWSSWNLIWTARFERGYAAGYWWTESIRAQAWAYRSLAQAASITPDTHALKSYFTTKLNNNLANDTAIYVDGVAGHVNGVQKNNLGAFYSGEKQNANEYRGFYDNFMSWAIQYIVDLGYTNAIPLRNYKLQFPIGLMGIASNEYCFQLAQPYNFVLGPTNTTWYTTFLEVYKATEPVGSTHVCGTQDMANYLGLSLNEMFGANDPQQTILPALAAAADSGLPGGAAAWARSQLSGVHPDYTNIPNFAVIPRGVSASTPSVTLVANPSSVSSGGSTSLSWSSASATSCTASGQWSGAKGTAGTETISNISSASTFTLNCSGSGGEASTTATLSVTTQGNNGDSGTGSGASKGSALSGGSVDGTFLAMLAVLLPALSAKQRRYVRALRYIGVYKARGHASTNFCATKPPPHK